MRVSIPRQILIAVVAVGTFLASPAAVLGDPNCTCRYAGQSYALDTCVCIVTPQGARMACCGMVVNNTSWTFTRNGCPVAAAPQSPDRPGLIHGEAGAEKGAGHGPAG